MQQGKYNCSIFIAPSLRTSYLCGFFLFSYLGLLTPRTKHGAQYSGQNSRKRQRGLYHENQHLFRGHRQFDLHLISKLLIVIILLIAIAGHWHRGGCHRHRIHASVILVPYGSIPVPNWYRYSDTGLMPHKLFFSFRTDRMPVVWHSAFYKLYEGGQLSFSAPQLSRLQRSPAGVQSSSVGFSVAQKSAAWLKRCSVAQKDSAYLTRTQYNSEGCSITQECAAQLRSVQVSSVGWSLTQKSGLQLSRVKVSSDGAVQQRVQHCLVWCSVVRQVEAQVSWGAPKPRFQTSALVCYQISVGFILWKPEDLSSLRFGILLPGCSARDWE